MTAGMTRIDHADLRIPLLSQSKSGLSLLSSLLFAHATNNSPMETIPFPVQTLNIYFPFFTSLSESFEEISDLCVSSYI